MAWRVFGRRFITSDFSGAPVYYQNFSVNENRHLKAIQAWFVFYNNPTWSGLGMDIYSVKNGVPYQLLWSSDDDIADADVLTTYENGVKGLYFSFTKAPFLRGGDIYALVPRFTSYTGDETSHIAWKVAFSRKIYAHYEAVQYINHVGRFPFDVSFLVSE